MGKRRPSRPDTNFCGPFAIDHALAPTNIGHVVFKGLDEGPEARLTTRLFRAFECELKTGLRADQERGSVILGGWATFVPLSGAVVPGALVVESEVKKIQQPRRWRWRRSGS